MAQAVGLSVEQMNDLHRRFEKAAQQLESSRRHLGVAAFAAWWLGPRADLFRGDWGARLSPNLASAALTLHDLAATVQRHIDEQNRASTAEGTSAPVALQPDIHSQAVLLDSMAPAERREYWLDKAAEHAGLDMSAWDPEAGLDANRKSVEAVYAYYSQLYLEDPARFEWAGMAGLMGASFYAGFQDLSDTEHVAKEIQKLSKYGGRIGGIPINATGLANLTAEEVAADLKGYQSMLLNMQKEIFVDMASAHEAYRGGGMEAIKQFYEHDPYGMGKQAIDAWKKIDSGDPKLIDEGNMMLLYREQFSVIGDDYDAMYQRPTGPIVTYLMTMSGRPSIPGANSFAEVFPIQMKAEGGFNTPDSFFGHSLPHVGMDVGASVDTPFPSGNIAYFGDRWGLIETDTLPAYMKLLEADKVRGLLQTPVAKRAEDYGFVDNLDDIVTSWDTHGSVKFTAGIG